MFFIFSNPNPIVRLELNNYVGLCKIDTDSYELKYLCSFRSTLDGDIIESIENIMLLKHSKYSIEFDTNLENIKLLYGDIQTVRKQFSDAKVSPPEINNGFINSDTIRNIKFGSSITKQTIHLSSAAIYKNKLWAMLGQSQVVILEKDKSFDESQIIDNDILNGEPVTRFVSTPYGLIGIGEGIVGLIDTENLGK